jgi:hypothetical protein
MKIGNRAKVDPLTLIDTRMLIQAGSGGGKSYMMRKLCEEVAVSHPFTIVDWEGEFSTLRDKLDVVVVGEDGDLPIQVKTARILAKKIAASNVSAVIDVSSLSITERQDFVKIHIEAMLSLPRSLWKPRLMVIDEAQQFAPERGHSKSSATEAVIALCCQGRKRGLGAVLATQRLSKLSKDAAAELRNVAIGLTTLEADIKRALDILGLPTTAKSDLRKLKPGQFYGFGPAFSFSGVEMFQVGSVSTPHLSAGTRSTYAIGDPSDAIRDVLAEMVDLDSQAKREVADLNAAKAEIVKLNEKVKKLESGEPVLSAEKEAELEDCKNEIYILNDTVRSQNEELLQAAEKLSKIVSVVSTLGKVVADVDVILGETPTDAALVDSSPKDVHAKKAVVRNLGVKGADTPRLPKANKIASGKVVEVKPHDQLNAGARRMVETLATAYPVALTESQWAFLSSLSPGSGTWRNYKSDLRGYYDKEGTNFVASRMVAYYEPDRFDKTTTPTQWADWYYRLLKSRAADMLRVVIDAGSITSDDLADAVGLSANSGNFRNLRSKLSTSGAVTKFDGSLQPSSIFQG